MKYGRWNPYPNEESRRAARRDASTKYRRSEKSRAWWAEYGEERKWRQHLKWWYGISPTDYLFLLEHQDDRCLVCHRLDVQLYVDHNHETKRVRGLLCNLCNVALGRLEDRPGRIDRAARYLEATSGPGPEDFRKTELGIP